MSSPGAPERWHVDAGARDVARLEIPPHATRDRTFEIACLFKVRTRGDDATHGLKLLVDGRQQWSRQVPTQPGPGDSLDYRFRRRVEAGERLSLVAVTEVRQAQRVSLVLTADEE